MSNEQRGVILYGYGVDAVAEALRELDQRYVPVDAAASESGQVLVVCCPDGAEADAVREAAPGIAWLVVELYRPEDEVQHARDVRLWLNTSQVEPKSAAMAIDQPDLVTWYEVIHPIRVGTVDDGAGRDDYSNLTFNLPDGNRMVAHAVQAGLTAPPCLPPGAEMVLPTDDLWVLSQFPSLGKLICRTCAARHA
ncbi:MULTISPECIES: hypothetical protein [unclassified Micromonospora]|uniref:hypothetical protein n=1 Tax=unclassified Micromonospora TaxID=2617518 RepID=UPI0022B60D3B|nr:MULTISPECIES: hypothetical protein [unclassified Micromonospora]MCZ7423630.1 hypothetical protein [Verrucosispora sp. WMMA2121]WBB91322.1 hypothetical protein O7597_30925 [Verrucosispora sp. WMMC514]